MSSVPSAEVARTVTQVFREPAYQWSTNESLFSRFLFWFVSLLHRLWRSVASVPGGTTVAKLTALALVLLVVGTLLYQLASYYLRPRNAPGTRIRSLDADAWNSAERCAQSGDYLAATHWLYVAFVRALVSNAGVRFHPSKTAGDYVRELRRLHNQSALDQFLPFVRAYEIIVYRDDHCDPAEYAHLRTLAEPAHHPYRTAA